MSEDERHQRQAQRAANRDEARHVRQPARGSVSEVAELEGDETLRAMCHTVENGGYDFMSKDDW